MTKPFFAANWKMNKTTEEVDAFLAGFRKRRAERKGADVVLIPSFTLLQHLVHELGKEPVGVGAQNMSAKDNGAFTGEVSAAQLLDVGVEYVVIGHSERRTLYGETDEMVHEKLHAALVAGLTPILAFGETDKQRKAGKTKKVVGDQLAKALKNVKKSHMKNIVLAYEPVWAIGTGNVATPEQAEEVHAFVRDEVGKHPPIIYGGSMKVENVAELMAQPHIDGGLVGGASLDPDTFTDLIQEGVRHYA